MRLLFMSDAFWPLIGGMELFAEELIPPLTERGVEITVLCARTDRRLPIAELRHGAEIRRLDLITALGGGDVDELLRVRAEVHALHDEVRPHLLYVSQPGVVAYYAMRLHERHGVPFVVGLHGQPEDGGNILRRLLAGADWVTVNSESVRRGAILLEPTVDERVSLIPYAFGARMPGGSAHRDAPLELRRATVRAPSAPVILAAAGRLSPEKGFDVLLRALVPIVGAHSNVRLILAGDGPERPSLEHLADQLGVASHITFLGWQRAEELVRVIDESTVVVVPSRVEGFGRVAVEASQRGRPVIASRVGGLPEAVEDGVSGILVDPDDPAAIARAVLELVADPVRAAALGTGGQLRAAREFSAETSIAAHLHLFARVAAPEPELVTCIVPIRDGARYLSEALDSILAQPHRPLEVIVVDDGSTDDSARIAASYGPPVRVISQSPQGAAAARNTGVLAARGSFLCFLDSDDCFAPTKLERQLTVFTARPETEVCLATSENVWEAGLEEEEALSRANDKVHATHLFGTMLARRSAFSEVGLLNAILQRAEQPEWFARMADQGIACVVIPDVLMKRRMHPGSHSHSQAMHDEFLDLVKARIDRRRAGD